MEFTLLQEARILYGAGKVQETGALLRPARPWTRRW